MEPLRLVWAAVNRLARRQRASDRARSSASTAMAALRAVTIDAAYQHFEEDRQVGSLEPGKLADLVILDAQPARRPRARSTTIRRASRPSIGGRTVYHIGD